MTARRRVPERMDDPALDPAEHRRALAGLARLNAISRPLAGLTAVVRHAANRLGRPVRVLDVACGGGDNLARLLRWSRRAGVPVTAGGCDLSPTALKAAGERVAAKWFVRDAVNEPLPAGFDVVTCSLFLHHLTEADAITLLASMKSAAGSAVVVNDLVRGRLNAGLVWVGSRLLSRSPVVHFDGPVSVNAAFTPAELRGLAVDAGLDGATVRGVFPSRMVLTWERP